MVQPEPKKEVAEKVILSIEIEERSIEIEILSITMLSDIPVCLRDKPVSRPNWINDPNLFEKNGRNSKRPGVFLTSGTGSDGDERTTRLGLELQVTGLEAHETMTLAGHFKSDSINFDTIVKGTIGGEPGTVCVEITADEVPAHFTGRNGEFNWFAIFRLEKFIFISNLVTTAPLEMYWIYDYPGKMYKKGVWAEVLRLLRLQCFSGLKEKNDVVQRIVNYCHSGTSLRYDIRTCANNYTDYYWGGSFRLRAFLERKHLLAVCFDQAGMVQTLLAAIGIYVGFMYLYPFGFLNITHIFGRGKCNNTDFLGPQPASEILDEFTPDNIKRIGGFGCHTFCLWQKNENERVVLDACVGPHLGTETLEEYLETVIDQRYYLYHDNKSYLTRPGRAEDVMLGLGIVDVHAVHCLTGGAIPLDKEFPPIPPPAEIDRVAGFIEKNEIDRERKKFQEILEKDGKKWVAHQWNCPGKCPELKDGWSLKHEHVRAGCGMATKEWTYCRGEEYISIEIFVTSMEDLSCAFDNLINFAATTPMPEIPFEKHLPVGSSHFQLKHKDNDNLFIWIFYNVLFRILSHESNVDLAAVGNWLQNQAEMNVCDNLEDFQKKLPDFYVEPNPIIPFREHYASIKVFPRLKNDEKIEDFILEFFADQRFLTNAPSLILTEQFIHDPKISGTVNPKSRSHFHLSFQCRIEGKTQVSLFLIDQNTLLCSEKSPWHRVTFDIQDEDDAINT